MNLKRFLGVGLQVTKEKAAVKDSLVDVRASGWRDPGKHMFEGRVFLTDSNVTLVGANRNVVTRFPYYNRRYVESVVELPIEELQVSVDDQMLRLAHGEQTYWIELGGVFSRSGEWEETWSQLITDPSARAALLRGELSRRRRSVGRVVAGWATLIAAIASGFSVLQLVEGPPRVILWAAAVVVWIGGAWLAGHFGLERGSMTPVDRGDAAMT